MCEEKGIGSFLDIRKTLSKVIKLAESGKIQPKMGDVINNSVGKYLHSIKVELEVQKAKLEVEFG